ncbi:MAG: PDZ domain-containing protein, partial [Chitinophagaceae bacterium]
VNINYDSSRIFVYSKGRFKYPRGGFLLKPSLVNIPVIGALVKDEKELRTKVYFDTGAGMCLLLSSDFVSDSIFINPKKKFYTTQAEGLGGKAPMRQGVIKQVRIGPYRFKKVPTYIFDDEYNVTSYPALAGLIGNDLLRRFNLYINYERRDIYMVPNSHFKDPFDYTYTGLGIYMVNGEITVVDIMPGSPAEAANFKAGDVVMAIDNNFTRDIKTYKSILQSSKDKIKVLIMRDRAPLILTLKVKSIL